MTRNDIEHQYQIVNGRIKNPGVFEGECLYVPYLWDLFLNGGADRDNSRTGFIEFDIGPDDREQFPELKGRRTVRIYQRDDGFVCEY